MKQAVEEGNGNAIFDEIMDDNTVVNTNEYGLVVQPDEDQQDGDFAEDLRL